MKPFAYFILTNLFCLNLLAQNTLEIEYLGYRDLDKKHKNHKMQGFSGIEYLKKGTSWQDGFQFMLVSDRLGCDTCNGSYMQRIQVTYKNDSLYASYQGSPISLVDSNNNPAKISAESIRLHNGKFHFTNEYGGENQIKNKWNYIWRSDTAYGLIDSLIKIEDSKITINNSFFRNKNSGFEALAFDSNGNYWVGKERACKANSFITQIINQDGRVLKYKIHKQDTVNALRNVENDGLTDLVIYNDDTFIALERHWDGGKHSGAFFTTFNPETIKNNDTIEFKLTYNIEDSTTKAKRNKLEGFSGINLEGMALGPGITFKSKSKCGIEYDTLIYDSTLLLVTDDNYEKHEGLKNMLFLFGIKEKNVSMNEDSAESSVFESIEKVSAFHNTKMIDHIFKETQFYEMTLKDTLTIAQSDEETFFNLIKENCILPKEDLGDNPFANHYQKFTKDNNSDDGTLFYQYENDSTMKRVFWVYDD